MRSYGIHPTTISQKKYNIYVIETCLEINTFIVVATTPRGQRVNLTTHARSPMLVLTVLESWVGAVHRPDLGGAVAVGLVRQGQGGWALRVPAGS